MQSWGREVYTPIRGWEGTSQCKRGHAVEWRVHPNATIRGYVAVWGAYAGGFGGSTLAEVGCTPQCKRGGYATMWEGTPQHGGVVAARGVHCNALQGILKTRDSSFKRT